MTQQSKLRDAGSAKHHVTIKSKMKTRTKQPEKKSSRPILLVDEEDEEIESMARDHQQMQVDPKEPPVESPDPIPTEPMASSPPTSLFSEDPHAEAEPDRHDEAIVQVHLEERPKKYRSSSLFSLEGDMSPLSSSTPPALPIDVELDPIQAAQSGPSMSTQDAAPQPMIVDEPAAVPLEVPPLPRTTVPEENVLLDVKGKGKRVPRKKGAVNVPPRPTRMTRSVSSRKRETEVSDQPCALSCFL